MLTAVRTADSPSNIRPAARAAVSVVLLGLLSSSGLIVSAGPPSPKWLFLTIIVLYTALSVARLIWPRYDQLVLSDRELILRDRRGREQVCRLRGRPFLSPLFLGLPLVRSSGKPVNVGLFASQLDHRAWRQALIRLRA